MVSSLCKIQYLGKAKTPFNINKHIKDADGKNPKVVPVSIHFKQPGHNFNKHAKFTLIKQINDTINTDINTIKIKLKKKADFWKLKHDTLTPERLNHEFSSPNLLAHFMFITDYHLPSIF